MSITIEDVYRRSDDFLALEIEGETVITPLVSDIGSAENRLFTLSSTAQAVWDELDGRRSLGEVARDLSREYDADVAEIERDVLDLVAELLERSMLVAV